MKIEGPRECRKNELQETLTLLDLIFHSNRRRRMGLYYPYAYGEKNLQNMRIITADGKIVSHAAIYPRFVSTADGLILKVGCIGGVATHAEHRKKGYATAILNDCIDIMRNEDYDISILWANVPGFYRKLGWELAGREFCFYLNEGNVFLLKSHRNKMSLDNEISDYSGIQKIYEKNVLRSQRQLTDYPMLFNRQRNFFCYRNPEVTAYILIDDGNSVLEYGGDFSLVTSILKELIELKQFSSLKVFTSSKQDNLSNHLEQLGVPMSSWYSGMIRVINEKKFLKRFSAETIHSQSLTGLSKLLFGPEKMPRESEPFTFYLWQSEHV